MNFNIYYVKDNDADEIVHTSYVIGKCLKFPFMKKKDIEIGSCYITEKYRGRGIYKNVLNFINNNCCEQNRRVYMIVSESNIASIKGIENAGFKRVGTVSKSNTIKIYRRVDDV